jgi:hypothetical protein
MHSIDNVMLPLQRSSRRRPAAAAAAAAAPAQAAGFPGQGMRRMAALHLDSAGSQGPGHPAREGSRCTPPHTHTVTPIPLSLLKPLRH